MSEITEDGQRFDPITGEILPDEEETEGAPAVPAQMGSVALGRELDNLPADFGALAEYFSEPEPDVRDIIKWIMGQGEMEQTDPEDTTRSILARILTADSEKQLLTGHRVTHAKEILNQPIEVTGVKWQRSAMEGGSTVYAVITAKIIGTEDVHTITCGGRNVMVQLLNAKHRGFLPLRCMIKESVKPTEAGYHPLWLEPA